MAEKKEKCLQKSRFVYFEIKANVLVRICI